jgi:hypothetical protein
MNGIYVAWLIKPFLFVIHGLPMESMCWYMICGRYLAFYVSPYQGDCP